MVNYIKIHLECNVDPPCNKLKWKQVVENVELMVPVVFYISLVSSSFVGFVFHNSRPS
jgi:hypothetical protein